MAGNRHYQALRPKLWARSCAHQNFQGHVLRTSEEPDEIPERSTGCSLLNCKAQRPSARSPKDLIPGRNTKMQPKILEKALQRVK